MKKILSVVTLWFLTAIISYAAEVPTSVSDSQTGSITVTPIAEPQTLAPEKYVPEKTIVLTEEETLAHWDDGAGNPAVGWELENGVLRRVSGSKDIFYKGDFENFVLEFEFQISEAGNSGVYYYAWLAKKKAAGYEYQIIDDLHRKPHPKMERFTTAGLYSLYHRAYDAGPMVLDGYNQGKIVVLGNHIEHWLNGKLAISIQTGTENWKSHVAQSRLNVQSNFGKMKTGRIAFQNHDHGVSFRNVRLTPYRKVDF